MSFVDAKLNEASYLSTTLVKLAAGRLDRYSTTRKFGRLDTVSTSSYVPIWSYGETTTSYPWPTSASTLFVTSSNGNDSGGGSGARTITISGLDSVFSTATETVTLAGATPVETTSSFRRVQSAFVASVGTYGGVNAGQIWISSDSAHSSGAVLGHIPLGYSQTQQLIYTVPAGYVAYVPRILVSAGTGKSVSFRELIRLNSDVTDTSGVVQPWRVIASQDGVVAVDNIETPFLWTALPPKTDAIFQAVAAGAGSAAAGAMDIILEQQ